MVKLAPILPGEVLMEDFIEPLGITQHKVAVAVGVPARRINEIVHGKRRISPDTALRLARYILGKSLDAIQPLRSAS
jgi:addiction module HigA family antidote